MKKILGIIFCLILVSGVAKADFAEHYNAGQQYLSQYQYSSAITEFKKALRINYLDNSARIGLVNSYMARGTYLANKDRNWELAANDYRAALFYLRYYATNTEVQNSMQAISNATQNLNQCLEMSNFDTSPKSRYEKARNLRLDGLFAEAGYEFNQTLVDSTLRRGAYEQIADIMKTLGNDPKSAEYYQRAIALDQSDAGLRLKYARVLDKLEQNDAAVKEYNYALAHGGDDPEILFSLERMYRQKLVQLPDDSATITNLGAILQKQGKLDEALQYYTKANQLDPSSVTTRLNVGTLYQQKKSYDSAIAAYDSILILYPKNLEASLFKAQCLAAKGDNAAAIEAFNRVLSIEPANKTARGQIFDSLKLIMPPSQIVSYFSKNSVMDKDITDDMYDYAIELHKQKKYDEAISFYREVLKFSQDNPEVYINLAIAYKQKNDATQAKQVLIDAKSKFPANKQIDENLKAFNEEAMIARFDEASKYFNNGDYQKAMSVYQSIQPPTFDSLSGVAACYKSLNNDNQAIEYYKKALNMKADSDVAYYIGVLYSEKENWADSKTYLKKAIAIKPDNERAKDLLGSVVEQANIKLVDDGVALYEKADYVKALGVFNRVLQEDPKNSYSLYYRGLINDVNKKYLAAIADYKKAVQYNSELTIIYYLIGLDYDNVAQYKLALANYKKYVSLTAENNDYKKYALSRIKALKKYEG